MTFKKSGAFLADSAAFSYLSHVKDSN